MSITIRCPNCHCEFTVDDPGFKGLFQLRCPGGHYVAVPLWGTTAGHSTEGGRWIVTVGAGAPRPLEGGRAYTIGRESPSKPSDISVPSSDVEASRRCAEISFDGPVATLRVLETTNPLQLRGHGELGSGRSASANARMELTIGTTPVIFKYEKAT